MTYLGAINAADKVSAAHEPVEGAGLDTPNTAGRLQDSSSSSSSSSNSRF
jgi:hypothetical protein